MFHLHNNFLVSSQAEKSCYITLYEGPSIMLTTMIKEKHRHIESYRTIGVQVSMLVLLSFILIIYLNIMLVLV